MNPIARMMKRYIKMPLKYALPLLFIGALVLSSTTGCVSNTTTTTSVTPTNSPPAAAQSIATQLDDAFTNQGLTIIKPFTESKNQFGNMVYAGTVQDGDKVLHPYQHKITIEVVKNRNDALTRFNAYKTQAKATGNYLPNTIKDTGWWWGWSDLNGSFDAAKAVVVNINEAGDYPSFSTLVSPSIGEYGVYWNTYTVSVDYQTRI
jgi:hypothetical protein